MKHRGTPYVLASTGETILAKRSKRWDRRNAVWLIVGDDGVEYVACGGGSIRKLVPLDRLLAYAAEHNLTVPRAARSFPVGT